jgi:hypothetical protein
MPHSFLIYAQWAGRVIAGIVGCFAFYMAFFLYEDEEGRWQNRIDELWVAVHDRARITDSVSIALFNKIAQTLVLAANRVFGKRLISIQMFAVSTNLSLAGASIVFVIATLVEKHEADSDTYVVFSSMSFRQLRKLQSGSYQSEDSRASLSNRACCS